MESKVRAANSDLAIGSPIAKRTIDGLRTSGVGAEALEMLLVVVDGQAEEPGDIETAVGRVRAHACPAGVVQRADGRDRPRPPPCEHGQEFQE
jgi:hypothetical protein